MNFEVEVSNFVMFDKHLEDYMIEYWKSNYLALSCSNPPSNKKFLLIMIILQFLNQLNHPILKIVSPAYSQLAYRQWRYLSLRAPSIIFSLLDLLLGFFLIAVLILL